MTNHKLRLWLARLEKEATRTSSRIIKLGEKLKGIDAKINELKEEIAKNENNRN